MLIKFYGIKSEAMEDAFFSRTNSFTTEYFIEMKKIVEYELLKISLIRHVLRRVLWETSQKLQHFKYSQITLANKKRNRFIRYKNNA